MLQAAVQHKKVTSDQASVCVQWEYRDWKYQKMGEVAYMQLSLTGKHKTRHRCQNLTVQLKPAGKKKSFRDGFVRCFPQYKGFVLQKKQKKHMNTRGPLRELYIIEARCCMRKSDLSSRRKK